MTAEERIAMRLLRALRARFALGPFPPQETVDLVAQVDALLGNDSQSRRISRLEAENAHLRDRISELEPDAELGRLVRQREEQDAALSRGSNGWGQRSEPAASHICGECKHRPGARIGDPYYCPYSTSGPNKPDDPACDCFKALDDE